ncbi:hypothetical protein G5B47_17355 [Paenibacillus sp. 7124]|uniref:Uncharacterized protein n=1 Tax=Paenibacillus apii TaxID=1850370 RepID=A0A6M1PP31_9BACL|nr:hypothetical protein [Paenibacillus apii]NGM84184.1 hypothetical protein [Paenibacillus apii]NJJ38636.1 hypothetical protein [Paenibacillus apii]
MILPATTERVEKHTNGPINAEIQQQTEQNIACWKVRSKPEIQERIRELDRDWDTERVLEANASAIVFRDTAAADFWALDVETRVIFIKSA